MALKQLTGFVLLTILASVEIKGTEDSIPASGFSSNQEFHEEIYVQPLSSGHVNTYFQFTTRWHYGEKANLHNTQLIPRAIAEILQQYDVKELHITLTQGLWRYESWGYPVVEAAPGAETWAWFSAQNLTDADVDGQWVRLANTFSGILCASLNFIDSTNSIAPKYGFRPQFAAGQGGNVPKFVRYATLPREVVCTENLTPWKKLLPCNSREGFASLLNSGHVHNTNFHSLGIKVRTLCERDDHNCVLEFTETANLVYDPKLLGNHDFSLRRLFGQGLNGHCALAKTSKIYVDLNEQPYDLSPLPMYNVTSKRGGTTRKFGVYDMQRLREDKLYNIAWMYRRDQKGINITPLPPIYAHRYILGHGQEKAQIITQVINNYHAPLNIVLQEQLPWFVPSYMHTLKLVAITAGQQLTELKPRLIHYIPGVQRTRPYHLEIAFELPPKSTVKISFDFDFIFLKWLEYPPDANHGHYLGSAVISTQLPVARNYTAIPVEGCLFADSFNATRGSYFLELRTETLILSLPTPDFSMPYNVICLACTVVALAFGPIHSVATKRIVVEQMDAAPTSILGKILHKLRRKQPATATDPVDPLDQDNQNELMSDLPEKFD